MYQHLLGLESPRLGGRSAWRVAEVRLDVGAETIEVVAEHPEGTPAAAGCPECGLSLACYDHAPPRKWRHLDSCQFKTYLIASIPRVQCPEHGVRQVGVPWAEGSSRFTLLFERLAIDVLLATQTVKGAMGLLRTNWDQTWNIVQRAVARGKSRKVDGPLPRIGIDEKAFSKGQRYLTLLYDLDHSTVEAISDSNDTEAGIDCFSQLSEGQIASVEAVAMDMSAAYVKAAKAVIPLADQKIVHDRFHVMQLATTAVDQVRRGEHRLLGRGETSPLTKTRYLWLTSLENLNEKQRGLLDEVCEQNLQTGKAWAYKEMLRDLWHHADAASATDYFKDWYKRVIHTKLAPIKKVARTIKQRLANVMSYCTHGITNAVAEGVNSKIMAIKRRVGGYRNKQHFKTAIFFYCGGLNLYP
ncbi:Transposase [Pirellulimonas nuda]|uniref:Transposase n=1 Tax=Pirellulimonas nuda TaxID=2528009 RepID=A0A518DA85_9BACT|nr:ISL3 family transposase [Pirellulimonas nuda]QDU88390.1 Transposase [Pirellulimonas nuda]